MVLVDYYLLKLTEWSVEKMQKLKLKMQNCGIRLRRMADLWDFRSPGFQYQGLFDNRGEDVLRLGVVDGIFGDYM